MVRIAPRLEMEKNDLHLRMIFRLKYFCSLFSNNIKYFQVLRLKDNSMLFANKKLGSGRFGGVTGFFILKH